MATFQYLKNVTTLKLDTEKCIGYGRCAEICPHIIFTIVDGKALIGDPDDRMECRACHRISTKTDNYEKYDFVLNALS